MVSVDGVGLGELGRCGTSWTAVATRGLQQKPGHKPEQEQVLKKRAPLKIPVGGVLC